MSTSSEQYDQARSIASMLSKLTDDERRAFNEVVALSRPPANAADAALVERCEGGCDAPVTHHDVEGVPLCAECWITLVAEQAGEDAALVERARAKRMDGGPMFQGKVGPDSTITLAPADMDRLLALAERGAAAAPGVGPSDFDRIVNLVRRERERQDAKWGVQGHDPERWIAILTEEVGEAARGALDRDWASYIPEMVQVAAVAIAAIECAARGERHRCAAPSCPLCAESRKGEVARALNARASASPETP